VDNPPTKFFEDYYTCKPDSLTTLQTAAGVASGNTSLTLPYAVFLFLPLVYYILLQLQQVPPPEEYTADEKATASDVLQTILLRLRDGKRNGVEKDGVLEKFYDELRTAAYASFQDDDYFEVRKKKDSNISFEGGCDKNGRHVIDSNADMV